MPPPEIDFKDDEKIAKLLATPVGRIGFAAVGGLLIYDAVLKLRGVIEMTDAWHRHVVAPARQRALDAERRGQMKVAEPPAENEAAQIDVQAPAEEPAGDQMARDTPCRICDGHGVIHRLGCPNGAPAQEHIGDSTSD